MRNILVLLCLTFLHMCAIPTLSQAMECVPVDLRDENITPERSQLYSYNGKTEDTTYCYAFTLANLISNRLGKSISPESIAIEYKLTWPEQGNVFTLRHGYGTNNMHEVFDPTYLEGNFCTSRDFSSYLDYIKNKNWYLSLHQRVNTLGMLNFKKEYKNRCKGGINESIDEVKLQFYVNQPEGHGLKGKAKPMEPKIMIEQIDRQLDKGNMVAFDYNAHYVTIAGRTKDCNYIIMDSLPHSYRIEHNFRNPYNKTEGEHIQLWTKKSLKEQLNFENTNPGSLPGIGYLEDR